MSDLPPGWEWATLDDVAAWGSGGTPRVGSADYYGGEIPWAVIGDLNDGIVDTTRNSITQQGLKASSAKLVPPGAILIAMYGSIGKLGIANRRLATNQAIAHAIPHDAMLDGRFLFWYLRSQRGKLEVFGKGATQRNISQAILRSWPIPVPPLAEQRRIASWLEIQLTCIDAASASRLTAQRRIQQLIKKMLIDAVPIPAPPYWQVMTVGEAGTIDLGRQRHPDWHTGSNMRPYLRVANVLEDRIDTNDIMQMHFPGGVFERFQLSENDILLNEGQSPEYLGRPAMYRGIPQDVAFTNSLLRFRVAPGIDPEWALLVFRRHLHAGRFRRETRITTNIAHLSAARFKTIEFPVPPLEEQGRIVSQTNERLMAVAQLAASVDRSAMRASALSDIILDSAFSGHFIRQDSNDESASVLLARIKEERAQPKRTLHQRSTRKNADEESML